MKTKGKTQIYLSRLLGKASRALHLIPPSLAMYSVEVTDTGGGHVSGYNSKSNSWVRNAMNWMAFFGLLIPRINNGDGSFGDGYLNVKDVAGVVEDRWFGNSSNAWYSTSNQQQRHCFQSTAAGEDGGIIVGSSSDAESFESYNLGSQILHGTSAGQLAHNAGSLVSISWDTVARKWVSIGQRTFTNNSGSDITVREIGYKKLMQSQSAGSNTTYYPHTVLMIRDVLSEPQTIESGQTLTVTFTIEFPY